MLYKEEIKQKIAELELKISKQTTRSFELEVELNRLKLAEFEEDLRETPGDSGVQFLKG
jgi:hypothetical protein